ncbi:MAG: NAD(P)H-hydrate epimerase [Planctomycetota bacterium]
MTALDRLKSCVLSTEQVRRVDLVAIERYGVHSLVLMENAALNCVRWIQQFCARRSRPPRTVILCGRGNNGGDGLVIARHLQTLGWPVRVLLLGPEELLSDDNLANWKILKSGSASERLAIGELVEKFQAEHHPAIAEAELVIDAMLGTGASGAPRAPFAEWIEAANTCEAIRIAIDIPTGVCAQTGAAFDLHFRPSHTLSFVARKPAMQLPDSSKLFGEVEILPIGLPQDLVEQVLLWADTET